MWQLQGGGRDVTWPEDRHMGRGAEGGKKSLQLRRPPEYSKRGSVLSRFQVWTAPLTHHH